MENRISIVHRLMCLCKHARYISDTLRVALEPQTDWGRVTSHGKADSRHFHPNATLDSMDQWPKIMLHQLRIDYTQSKHESVVEADVLRLETQWILPSP